MNLCKKKTSDNLALFGGAVLFDRPRSTSNLVSPNTDLFFQYSRRFYNAGQYTNNGELVQELEKKLAEFHGTKYCVSFCSGFWTLVLAIRCLALDGKKEVIMPSLTYRRLADVVSWAGLIPNFCEVDSDTLAISAKTAESKINSNTALIIGVHPIVNCCDSFGLERLGEKHDIPVLFDGVESVYETVEGKKVGSFGSGECFSLHASKLINGFEGGYLTTNNISLKKQLSLMRGFGFASPDEVVYLGMNAKLNEVHAAMALAGLDDIESQILNNKKKYYVYKKLLLELDGIRLLEFNEKEKCSYKNIVIELTDEWPLTRKTTIDVLNSDGILSRAYYSPPLHLKKHTYKTIANDLSITSRLSERFLIMPSGHLVSIEDIYKIVCFLDFIKKNAEVITKRAIT